MHLSLIVTCNHRVWCVCDISTNLFKNKEPLTRCSQQQEAVHLATSTAGSVDNWVCLFWIEMKSCRLISCRTSTMNRPSAAVVVSNHQLIGLRVSFSRVSKRLWNVSAGLWAVWCQSGSRSLPEWRPASSSGCRKTRNLSHRNRQCKIKTSCLMFCA